MESFEVKEKWKEAWSKLPFSDFPEKYLEQGKKEEHMREAGKILNLLKTGNVGLVAETGAGKTIISLLVVLAERCRTLFLTSRIGLTVQHQKMLNKITGNKEKSVVISGQIIPRKRDWNNFSDVVVFATPHVAMREYTKGRIDWEKFDLIIFDEMHNASGNYPFVPIAEIAKELADPPKFLCLSASPGDSEEKIKELENIFSIQHWHVANIKTPRNPQDFILAEATDELHEIDCLFKELFRKTAEGLENNGYAIDTEKFLTWSELEWIARENNHIKGTPEYFKTLLLLAKYRKLSHAHSTVLTESYPTFLDYCHEKLELDRSRAGMSIFESPAFRKIMALAEANQDNHPKIEALIKAIKGAPMTGKNAIIFVWQKKTGDYIKKRLIIEGFRAEMIAGGPKKNAKRQDAALESLKSGKIDYLISTSVIEEGLNIPEVNAVIQYSLPKTGTAKKQRSGRTGRLEQGYVLSIVLNHPIDRGSYWAKMAAVKKIDKLIAGKSGIPVEKNLKSPVKKTRRKKDELTLPLF